MIVSRQHIIASDPQYGRRILNEILNSNQRRSLSKANKRGMVSMSSQEKGITVNNSEVPETESASTQPTRGKPFGPGQSGNPKGRPKGSRNKSTLVREKIEQDIAAVLDVVLQQALAGDRASQRLLLERVVPRAKNPTVSFDLPEKIDTPEALAEASAEIVQRIADGNILPEQGRILMSVLKDHSVNLENSNASKANASGADAKLIKPYRPPTMADWIEKANEFEKETGWPASDVIPKEWQAQYEQGIRR
jgi:hypothetical protein